MPGRQMLAGGALVALATLLAGASAWAEPLVAPLKYRAMRAVVVGIETYRHSDAWKTLPNAEVDARRFAALMRSRGVAVTTLYGSRATREAVLNALDDAAGSNRAIATGQRSLLIVYFAGHGTTRAEQGYLVPYGGKKGRSSSWIAMGTLRQKSREMSHIRHQLFILGSCFGGTLLRSSARRDTVDALATRLPAGSWLGKALDSPARLAFTAGLAHEAIPDGPRGAGSEFGNAVVNALVASGGATVDAADYNRDGCVTASEWFAFVSGQGKTVLNTPFSGRMPGDGQGTVVLCRRWPQPGPAPSVQGALRYTPENGCAAGDPQACLTAGLESERSGSDPSALKKANGFFEKSCKLSDLRGCSRLGINLRDGRGSRPNLNVAMTLFGQACLGDEMLGCAMLGLALRDGKGLAADPKRARKLLGRACDGGEVSGCLYLAEALAAGRGGAVDLNEANVLFKRACDGGRMSGCSNYARSLAQGRGVSRDINRANELLRRACDGKDLVGCIHLGRHYQLGHGFSADAARATALFRRACAGDVALGCVYLALDQQRSTRPNIKQANRRFARACDQGHQRGCVALGVNLARGNGLKRNVKKAARLWTAACDAHEASGCARLGQAHEEGWGVRWDLQKARALYKQACEAGDPFGCGQHGFQTMHRYHWTDHGSYQTHPAGEQKGRELLRRSCGLGEALACRHLGLTMSGRGMFARASAWFRKACDGNEPLGCWYLLKVNYRSLLVPADKDLSGAASRMEAACKAGVPRACRIWGWAQENGYGTAVDQQAALKAVRRGCAGGDGWSCFDLAQRYARGEAAVTKDEAQAIGQFKNACIRGVGEACYKLARRYRDGKGVKKNLKKSKYYKDRGCFVGSPLACQFSVKPRRR